jgi:mannosyltransferase OCH1-like enzyme
MGKWMIAGLVLVVCIGLYVIFHPLKRNIECFEDYLMDTQNKSTIPLDIYQTWKTKDLPPQMRECVETLKRQNPEFKHHLYDDADCYQFIKDHFDPEVAEAYDVLIPGAYKADLWRYCVLYKRGGIYLDIKFQNEGDFKLVELTDREYWTKDIPKSEGGIYNACMICLPGNSILKKCIDRIVENVRTRYYGPSYLHPTGPMLVKSVMSQSELKEVDRSGLKMVVQENPRVIYIHKDNHPILKTYDEYYSKDNPRCQYADLWNQRNIYK